MMGQSPARHLSARVALRDLWKGRFDTQTFVAWRRVLEPTRAVQPDHNGQLRIEARWPQPP